MKNQMTDSNITLARKIVDMVLAQGAQAADVLVSDSASLGVSVRMGKLEDTERAESRDVGVRAIIGQQQAFVSGSAIDEKSLARLAEQAVNMSRAVPEDRFCGLAEQDALAKNWPDLDIFDATEPSNDQLQAMAQEAEDVARSHDGITNSEGAGVGWSRGTTALVTSHGFEGAYTASNFSIGCTVVGGQGEAMERDYASHNVRHLADLDSPAEIGHRAASRTLKRLNPRKSQSAKIPVVYDPRVASSLLGHLVSAISGAAIARGTSFLKDALQTQIMPPDVQIIDDPQRPRGLRSVGFDGEGVAPDHLQIVRDGILSCWLLDTATARQLSLTSNGHAARGIGAPPSPSATNLYMAAGKKSVKTLLADIGTGFYVTELIGMGVNGVTGDYSRGASGFWIENGALAYPVSEITIAGNLRDMFAHLTPADDLQFRYGINAPTLLVENMMLAGL